MGRSQVASACAKPLAWAVALDALEVEPKAVFGIDSRKTEKEAGTIGMLVLNLVLVVWFALPTPLARLFDSGV